ncbi:MAG TPA: Type 1 glutamine amidotransferase-like domain-containing protein, partial [Candidatus Limnocylindrales bacterium]|nr:Type 1 glutamine amidotransferase-like domain-containing protein [Candidatus Limnocylindrales bacterium]
MKLLLTSAGVNNPSIRATLVELLGKPIEESNALAIPTAGWGSTYGHRPTGIMKFITGTSGQPMTDLGWKSVGLLELTALPSLDRERWTAWVDEADVLLVNGGDGLYLAHWLRESGLAGLFPSLRDKVYVGFSAGSMA